MRLTYHDESIDILTSFHRRQRWYFKKTIKFIVNSVVQGTDLEYDSKFIFIIMVKSNVKMALSYFTISKTEGAKLLSVHGFYQNLTINN